MGKEEKPRQRLASYLLRPDYPGTAENCQSKGQEVGLDPQQPPAPGLRVVRLPLPNCSRNQRETKGIPWGARPSATDAPRLLCPITRSQNYSALAVTLTSFRMACFILSSK